LIYIFYYANNNAKYIIVIYSIKNIIVMILYIVLLYIVLNIIIVTYIIELLPVILCCGG